MVAQRRARSETRDSPEVVMPVGNANDCGKTSAQSPGNRTPLMTTVPAQPLELHPSHNTTLPTSLRARLSPVFPILRVRPELWRQPREKPLEKRRGSE